MSFWTLEEGDMHDIAYLFPQILGPSGKRVRWHYILKHYAHPVLVAMLVASILFGCAVLVSGAYISKIAVLLAVRNRGPHHVTAGLLYLCIGTFLIYTAVRIAQSCIRLAAFLKQRAAHNS
jgi:hypothetical protein